MFRNVFHIYQIDNNGKVVNKFKSVLEAVDKYGFDRASIYAAMSSLTEEGKLYRQAGGYYWVDISNNPNYEIDFKRKQK